MKTHVTINGEEIKLIQEDVVYSYSMGSQAVTMQLNEDHEINLIEVWEKAVEYLNNLIKQHGTN